jgi:hypothetical protein
MGTESRMRAIAQIEKDGRLTIDAEVTREAGFMPGESVEVNAMGPGLVVAPCLSMDSALERWRWIDRSRPPMSLDVIVAEQREMRGHDDLD